MSFEYKVANEILDLIPLSTCNGSSFPVKNPIGTTILIVEKKLTGAYNVVIKS